MTSQELIKLCTCVMFLDQKIQFEAKYNWIKKISG